MKNILRNIRSKLPKLKRPNFKSFISNKEILSKIVITIGIVVIYRFLASVPLPGVDMTVYDQFFGKSTASEINYLFTIFTGGRVETPSLVGLGLAAYINASIVMQMLPYAIGRLKELQKDGERGKQIINQITRWITFPLSIFYSVVYIIVIAQRDLGNTNSDPAIAADPNHIPVYLIQHAPGGNMPTIAKIAFMAIILTAGTLLLMWLSELITERGLGNGSSVIISIGILSTLPVYLNQDFARTNISEFFNQLLQGNLAILSNSLAGALLIVVIGFVIVIAGIIFINESFRRLPINYARRVRAGEIGKGSFLPIKFTITGVLPIIFTYAILSIPQIVIPLIENVVSTGGRVYTFLESLKTSFLYAPLDTVINEKDLQYSIVYFILVIIFTLFYSYIVLNPQETAENLQKSGAYIPGIRPGKTTENYLSGVLWKVSLIGGVFLAIIAEIPILARDWVLNSSGTSLTVLSGIGGTSVLIIVSVIIETIRQYKSLKATRDYEKFAMELA